MKVCARQLPPILSSKEKAAFAGGLSSIFVKSLLLPPVYHNGGGGQANFTGKCINFLTGADSPARNGAPACCAGAASAAGERPAGRFSSVSPLAGNRPFTAPAPRAAGPRPGESQRPPRARSRARAGGADDLHQPEPEETAGAAPRPRSAPATFAGSEFRRARAGAGCAAAALWAAIQCRAYLERGVWGGKQSAAPPRATRLPAGKPGARGASPENDQLQASGERARRPEGEGAAVAALPGLCRAWLFRGELLLHPLRGGLAAGCSCAAAHPPSGLFLGKIFGMGNDAARRIAAVHITLQVAVHVTIVV